MGQMKNLQQIKLFKIRCIVLIFVLVLFQHFSFATHQHNFQSTKLNRALNQNGCFEKEASDHQETQLQLIIDVEPEDEDEVQNEKAVCNEFISSNQYLKASNYSDAIYSLYLRLAFLDQHKVDLPFFILYHSWKSHLA